ncbi:prolipoprotein diacylglyceryl transferase [Hymenobacter sp. BT186]|uniref:Prolipoprotein diacylglyceryl transferase n=1 Tax=Hymenobacter telluris TaxID=2816474 RepID=A0A939JAK6_9BACT|nr:prolipoprotein diacylglyceryl transferase family protein [Hymenobacter telluris]MBO0356335.1 prolipoprotein diacylglyceryl transferase [Hymenobacter telluris]MBW3372359.1 prolipoprotein diacylglyceryl transferase [Hymenobacter norwichensis]
MPLFATLLLPSPEGHHYYTTCYVAAFAVQLALLLWAGYRRGYPLQTWLVLIAASTLAFIVGTKLLALPANAWPALLQHGTWPDTTARSVLGGGLGFGVVVLLLRRWLGFGWHVADAFAMPFCAGLVVQCVGCLLTGCCFGEVTDSAWGITYAAGSIPYIFQQQQGLLEMGATHSLALHPTQLYTLVLCAGTGLVLWLTRHRRWPAGSWALLQAGLLVLGRLVIEFWREPAGEPVGATFITLGGIRMMQLQWLLLPYTIFLLGVWGLFVYHARTVNSTPEVPPRNQPVRNLLVVVVLLVGTLLLPAGALTQPELVVVKVVLLVVVLLATTTVLQGAMATRRAGLPLAAAAVVLLFTNQVPADSTRAYFSFTPGFISGAYDQDINGGGGGGSCSSPAYRVGYYHKYQAVGGDFAYTRPSVRTTGRVSYGVGLWGGNEYISAQPLTPGGPFLTANPKDGRRFSLLDINPYIQRDRIRASGFGYGIRLGVHIGTLAHLGDPDASGSDGLQTLAAVPEATIWLGVRRTLFVQGDYAVGPLGVGNPTGRIALGSGLGSTWSRQLLAGVALAEHDPTKGMAFLSASVPLGNTGLWAEPYGATNFGRHHQVAMRLQYRLSKKH